MCPNALREVLSCIIELKVTEEMPSKMDSQ